jgi:hypothetical protein
MRVLGTFAACQLVSFGARAVPAGGARFAPRRFEAVARALDLAAFRGACRYSESELAAAELVHARWPFRALFEADWGCLALLDNLRRDSLTNCLPDPKIVFLSPQPGSVRITGAVGYLGLVPLPYRYYLSSDANGNPVVTLRVHFTGALARQPENLQRMARKLAQAAELWSDNSPASDFAGRAAEFRFMVEAHSERAEFSLGLSEGCPRPPYLVSWGILCSPHFLAHEIGHMLGLDDEYNQLAKTVGHLLGAEHDWARDVRLRIARFECNVNSLMCSSKFDRSTPRLYDDYLVLRRGFCSRSPQIGGASR